MHFGVGMLSLRSKAPAQTVANVKNANGLVRGVLASGRTQLAILVMEKPSKPPGKSINDNLSSSPDISSLLNHFSHKTLHYSLKGGPPPRRATPSSSSPMRPGMAPAPQQSHIMPSAPMGQPPRRPSMSAAPPRGPPPSRGHHPGMAPPGVGPNSPKPGMPRGPAPTPPKGPPPRGPPPRGPPGHYLGRPSFTQGEKV